MKVWKGKFPKRGLERPRPGLACGLAAWKIYSLYISANSMKNFYLKYLDFNTLIFKLINYININIFKFLIFFIYTLISFLIA